MDNDEIQQSERDEALEKGQLLFVVTSERQRLFGIQHVRSELARALFYSDVIGASDLEGYLDTVAATIIKSEQLVGADDHLQQTLISDIQTIRTKYMEFRRGIIEARNFASMRSLDSALDIDYEKIPEWMQNERHHPFNKTTVRDTALAYLFTRSVRTGEITEEDLWKDGELERIIKKIRPRVLEMIDQETQFDQ